jgi:hypothetical protein
MTKEPGVEIPMTKEPNPNQIPSPNDQIPKKMLSHGHPFWDLGFGHWDLIGIWLLGHL